MHIFNGKYTLIKNILTLVCSGRKNPLNQTGPEFTSIITRLGDVGG